MVQSRTNRFKSDISIKGTKAKKPEPVTKMCEAPDCVGPGNCRVSKSPKNLSEYVWLCPKHARLHNESWDYFKGMDDNEIKRNLDSTVENSVLIESQAREEEVLWLKGPWCNE